MSGPFPVLDDDYRPDSWDGNTFPMPAPGDSFARPWTTGPQRRLSLAVATVTEPIPQPPPPPYFPVTPSLPLEHLYVVWDSFGDTRLGIQACGGCGEVFTDESLRDRDAILAATRHAARLAGWGVEDNKWLCPGCREKRAEEAAARPPLPSTGPGTEAYEANLLGHLAFLAETGRSVTVVAEVQLRAADLCHYFGIAEAEAIEQAAAVVAERRAAA